MFSSFLSTRLLILKADQCHMAALCWCTQEAQQAVPRSWLLWSELCNSASASRTQHGSVCLPTWGRKQPVKPRALLLKMQTLMFSLFQSQTSNLNWTPAAEVQAPWFMQHAGFETFLICSHLQAMRKICNIKTSCFFFFSSLKYTNPWVWLLELTPNSWCSQTCVLETVSRVCNALCNWTLQFNT